MNARPKPPGGRPSEDQNHKESANHKEEREVRIAEIMARVKHHQEEAARLMDHAAKLKAQGEPKRRRSRKR